MSCYLSPWIPHEITLSVEVKDGLQGNECCDLVLSLPRSPPVLLELMASGTHDQVIEHYKRAVRYGQAIGAEEVWVVHFVATGNRAFPFPPASVRAAHVCHDAEYKRVSMLTLNATRCAWTEDFVVGEKGGGGR